MIYFLSDQHGGERIGELTKYLEEATDDDLLIILGDVGLKFRDTEENRAFDELLLSAKKKIAFIDGNHENFDYLESFPMGERYGAPVRILTDNLVWLQRGYIYKIEGKSFFVFGGCRSGAKWKTMGLWWPQEAPRECEISRAYANLKACGRKVDYVLTHKYEEGLGTGTAELYELCDYINKNVEYKMWYAGHWHEYRRGGEKLLFVYDVLVPLDA
jgi:predicted phosphodiesterase